MTTRPESLLVWANGHLMGVLKQTRGGLEFTYEQAWLADAAAYPLSLSLPLGEVDHRGKRVHDVLDNLLPDSAEVRQAIARNVGARGTDVYSLLATVGKDCVGALQFLRPEEEPWRGGPIEADPLEPERIAEMLATLDRRPLGMTEGSGFRISVAGAQAKTTLLKQGDDWFLPTGPTPSTHILKPAIGNQGGVDLRDSVENEFICLRLVDAMGLGAAEASVEEFGGVRALVVERFDRRKAPEGIGRLPQEDLCQAFGLPSERKYEADGGIGIRQVMEFLLGANDPLHDRERFFRSVIAFWLLGAVDGHAKNFSVLLGPEPYFQLAPLYDVISLEPYVERGLVQPREYRLAMAVGEKRRYRVGDVMPRHFVQEAKRAGIDENTAMDWIRETAQRALEATEIVYRDIPSEMLPILEPIAAGVEARSRLALSE